MQQPRLFQSFNRNKSSTQKKLLTPLFQPQQLPDFSEDEKPVKPLNNITNIANSPSLKARFKNNINESSQLKREFKPRQDYDSFQLSENDSMFNFEHSAQIKHRAENEIARTPPTKERKPQPYPTPDENNLFDFFNHMKSLMEKKTQLESEKKDLKNIVETQGNDLEQLRKIEAKSVEFINEFQNNKQFIETRLGEIEKFSQYMATTVKNLKVSSDAALLKRNEFEIANKQSIEKMQNDLEEKNISLSNTILINQKLIEEKNTLSIKVASLEDKINAEALVFVDFKANFCELQDKHQKLEIELIDKKSKEKNVSQLLQLHEDEIVSLKAENKKLRLYVKDLETANLVVLNEKAKLEDSARNCDASLFELKESLGKAENDLEIAGINFNELNIRYAALSSTSKSLENKIKDLEMNGADAKKLTDKFEILYLSILKLNEEKQSLMTCIASMEKSQAEISTELRKKGEFKTGESIEKHSRYLFLM
eukprot:NODE_19_length_47148_cov_1.447810.p7 type:complete len:482 gc:universal NODE_19_length_47148_cov_1.447810:35195-36640(+)